MTSGERMSMLLCGVERAQQHVHDLEAEIAAFLQRDPYVVRAHIDAQSRERVFELTEVPPVPPVCARILGEAVGVLRSTLNRFVFQMFAAANSGKTGWHIQYPIADGVNEYPSTRDGKVEGLPAPVIAALDATKPYMGANNALWGIDYLHRINQRGPIRLVGVCTNAVYRRCHGVTGIGHLIGAQFFLGRPARALEPGHELLRLPSDPEQQRDLQFTFDVAIGEFKVPLAYPVVESLQGMTDLVHDLIGDFRPHLG